MITTTIFPGRYVQGYQALTQLGSELSRLGKKGLAILAPSAYKNLRAALKAQTAGVMEVEEESFNRECCETEIERLYEKGKRGGCNLIVGIGGGKTIDTSKIVANRLNVPVAIVPTIASTDAPCSACAVVYNEEGAVQYVISTRRNPDLVLVDTENREAGAIDGTEEKTVLRIRSDMDDLHDALVLGVRDYAKKCGFRQAVLGLSGGIDSALTAVIAVHALGAENVIGVTMPSRYSSQGSLDDSYALAKNLGIRIETIPIEGLVGAFGESLKDVFAGTSPGLAEENVQARIRGTLLMSLSNKFGWLLLTTGNKSELSTGYCTLYGDMNGGLSVLGDVLKTRVYELSRWINRERIVIPEETITKPPSAELRPDQKDSDSLPEYDLLDWVLSMYLEEQMDGAEIMACGLDGDLVKRILSLVERNEYKRRQAPPVLRVTGKAFGSGRRMPIAARVRYE